MQEIKKLKNLSEIIGNNISLIQASGGNVSIKSDGMLTIKASGTFLRDANKKNIFVSIPLDPVLRDFYSGSCFNPLISLVQTNLARPSIETLMHAVIPYSVVIHVHCINTISISARTDALDIFSVLLRGISWCFIPYLKPGPNLALKIRDSFSASSFPQVFILGNHGLVIAGHNCDDVSSLLNLVIAKLQMIPPAFEIRPDLVVLEGLIQKYPLRLPRYLRAHILGLDAQHTTAAAGGSLYPDHVVFLGRALHVYDGEPLSFSDVGCPQLIAVPNAGLLVHDSVSVDAEQMVWALTEVVARISGCENIRYLTNSEEDELLFWGAEEYRKSMI